MKKVSFIEKLFLIPFFIFWLCFLMNVSVFKSCWKRNLVGYRMFCY